MNLKRIEVTIKTFDIAGDSSSELSSVTDSEFDSTPVQTVPPASPIYYSPEPTPAPEATPTPEPTPVDIGMTAPEATSALYDNIEPVTTPEVTTVTDYSVGSTGVTPATPTSDETVDPMAIAIAAASATPSNSVDPTAYAPVVGDSVTPQSNAQVSSNKKPNKAKSLKDSLKPKSL